MAKSRKKEPTPVKKELPEITERLLLLQRAFSDRFPTTAAWVRHIDVEYNRWSNVCGAHPLSKELALHLVRRIPGLSLDWLWFGRKEGLSFELAQRLDKASERRKATTEPS
jgi:hypothetical protein